MCYCYRSPCSSFYSLLLLQLAIDHCTMSTVHDKIEQVKFL